MRTHRILQGFIVILTLMSGALLGSRAEAQALFRPATTADESAASAQIGTTPPQTIRQRLARIDGNALARHLAPAGADLAANRVARANRLDGVVVLNLFPDVTATFRRSDVSAQDGGGYIWEGEVAGQQFQEALLLVRNGEVNGRIQLENRLFEIKSVRNGVHQIIEYDPSKIPQGGEPLVPPHSQTQQNSVPAQESVTETNPEALLAATAKLLVVYTPAAVTEAGGLAKLKTEINVAVALANQSYKRAKVPLTLKVVATVPVNYNEGSSAGSSYSTNLSDITNGTGVFGAVQTKRNQFKADLVALIRKAAPPASGSFVCGLAWVNGGGSAMVPITAADAPYGYSVTGRGVCLTDLAFGHELGHNMGMQHDRFQMGGGGPNSIYNYGYTNLPKKVHTIMAYFVQCANQWGFGVCTHINYFSSPTIRGPGNAVLGIATNKPGAADNSKRLRGTYRAISKFR